MALELAPAVSSAWLAASRHILVESDCVVVGAWVLKLECPCSSYITSQGLHFLKCKKMINISKYLFSIMKIKYIQIKCLT